MVELLGKAKGQRRHDKTFHRQPIDKFTGCWKQCGNNVNYACTDRAAPAVINRIRAAATLHRN